MFAFVHQNENRMELFKVLSIQKPETRPEHWDLVEHKKRNVLILSPKIKEIKWSTYKNKIDFYIKFYNKLQVILKTFLKQ